MEPAVDLRAAVTLLGRFPALAGVDLRVDAGEVVLLRGPNGAGKTTLLRTCAGLLAASSGRAQVLGHDLADGRERRAVRRRVALLGHATGLYDDLTVADNVAFWGRAGGADDADVAAALAALGLDGRLASVAVARLSAGQRRRTALACVVARRAELWLLDEPHAGLDAAGRDLLDHLVRHAVAAGATVLLASHELDRAAALAARHVTIAGGVVVEDSDMGRSGRRSAPGRLPPASATGRLLAGAPDGGGDMGRSGRRSAPGCLPPASATGPLLAGAPEGGGDVPVADHAERVDASPEIAASSW